MPDAAGPLQINPREHRRVALLAAAVAWLQAEEQRSGETSTTTVTWKEAGRCPQGPTSWNPRRGTDGWRMAGRLETQFAFPFPRT